MGDTEPSVFVGDLAPEVSEQYLESYFRQYFPSVRSAKVITDPASGRSKGYGFVRFASEAERDRALVEMNGVFIGSRQIRISLASAKKAGDRPASAASEKRERAREPMDGSANMALDPENTTLFIGGLVGNVSEDDLRAIFGRYGPIIYTKIPQNKGCGFVQFVDRRSAEYAMQELNNTVIGNHAVRISWGKSATKATQHTLPAAQAAAAAPYSYGTYAGYPGYDAYGYGAYGADPYASSYPTSYSADPYAGHTAGTTPQGAAATPAAIASSTSAQQAPAGATVSIYDPLAPISVERLNTAFIHRNLSWMTGGYTQALRSAATSAT